MKFNTEQQSMLGILNGPVWHDDCEHGPDCFIASFEVAHHEQKKVSKYDLYVFHEHKRQSVCIRYGDEAGEYISPGSVIDFIQSAVSHRVQAPEYWAAYQILIAAGSIEWKPQPQAA